MIKLFLFFLYVLIITSVSFCQVDLSHLEEKKDTKTNNISNVSKSTKTISKEQETKKSDNIVKNKSQNTKSQSQIKKPVKKNVKKSNKKDKYVFKKEEQNFYKFDEKGNPITNRPVKKSTTTTKISGELVIGVENKNVKVK